MKAKRMTKAARDGKGVTERCDGAKRRTGKNERRKGGGSRPAVLTHDRIRIDIRTATRT